MNVSLTKLAFTNGAHSGDHGAVGVLREALRRPDIPLLAAVLVLGLNAASLVNALIG